MDIPNAFVGKAKQPTAEQVSAALGASAKIWKQFVDWMAEGPGVTDQQWKSISPKYGWALRLKLKKRTIVHLSPCDGCFRAVFILGDGAVKAARQSKIPKSVAKAIEHARRYTEGTGIRLMVKGSKDLAVIRELVLVKLAN